MKRITIFILSLLCCCSLSAQQVRKSYTLSHPVHDVEVMGAFKVVYSHTVSKVTVEADSAFFKNIHVQTLRNKPTLRVRFETKRTTTFTSEKPVPTVYIPMAFNIEDFDLSGACTFTATRPITGHEISFDLSGASRVDCAFDMPDGELSVDMAGAGKFNASGRVRELSLDISGAGSFNSDFSKGVYQFSANRVECDMAGAGKVAFHCVKSLEADLSGACTLSYSGNPVTATETAGSCTINHR